METARPEILALIPARGGSKSIPRKNIRSVAGKPLIAYSIEHAVISELITRVIVSTDDSEISEVARHYGAEVPFLRPFEYAGDLSPDIDVFRHALRWLAKHEAYKPDVVVHLRPTMPLRKVSTIDWAIRKFLEHPEVHSLRSVSLAKQSPYKMWHIAENEYLCPIVNFEKHPEPYNMPRQSLPPVYWQNGYIDVVQPNVILGMGTMTGERILAFVVDEICVEVDYEESIVHIEDILRHAGKLTLDAHRGSNRHPS